MPAAIQHATSVASEKSGVMGASHFANDAQAVGAHGSVHTQRLQERGGRNEVCSHLTTPATRTLAQRVNIASPPAPAGLQPPLAADRPASESGSGESGALDLIPPFDLALYDMDQPSVIFDDVLYDDSVDNVFNSVYHNLSISTCSSSSTSSGTPDNSGVEFKDDDGISPKMVSMMDVRINSLLTPPADDSMGAQSHQLPPEFLELL
jgi:hypothetical protein